MRHAARVGIMLGLLFIIKYICLMYSLTVPALAFLYAIGTAAVPFVAYRLTRSYRELIPASIGFPLPIAWAHGVFLYLFASLLVMLPHYIFYTDLLPSQLPALELRLQAEYREVPQMKALVEQMLGGNSPIEVIKLWLSSTSTASKLWNDFSSNLFWGSLLSLLNAFILRRRPIPAQ